METEYSYVKPGLPEELSFITLPEVVEHLKNYLGNFLLDPAVTSVYVKRLLGDEELQKVPEAAKFLVYLVDKLVAFSPFELSLLNLALSLQENRVFAARLKVLEGLKEDPEVKRHIRNMINKGNTSIARNRLLSMLREDPTDILTANTLLSMDYNEGVSEPDWTYMVKCPSAVESLWTLRLFNHYAALNAVDKALSLWDGIDMETLGENELNMAAEVRHKKGETNNAIHFYMQSLRLDPLQTPVKLRLDELTNPLKKKRGLTTRRKTVICLYSYNKASFLKRTLESLSRTRIGKAKITVLLNGCIDESRDVVNEAKGLFPPKTLDCITLPVNIGAPAARNWLIARPETWKSDYAAFLDDDVELPEDWLERFLDVMEERPKAAVVGCKVVYPGEPSRFQYLYRNISIARNNFIRLSLNQPINRYDNGLYDFTRNTVNVMGCAHLMRTEFLKEVPSFDLRFSPSQMDDIAHDIEFRLKGYDVLYCGLVKCVHHQNTGVSYKTFDDISRLGNVLGNDVKFFYKFSPHLEDLKKINV